MNFSSNTQLAREHTRELHTPRRQPTRARNLGLIGRLRAARAR